PSAMTCSSNSAPHKVCDPPPYKPLYGVTLAQKYRPKRTVIDLNKQIRLIDEDLTD
ncbi:MAG: hypothetical protein UW64_C0018G0023, partial [Microgenomates group bacterium GW2011_GWC1_44_37]